MRIEVDKKIAEMLDRIKAENHIYGKGHTDTLSFLVNYYDQHKKVVGLIEEGLERIPEAIEKSTAKAFQNVLSNLFKMTEG